MNPITTTARARQASPPSRKANGVEVPENEAANDVLYAMAMAGERTAMAMATASIVESVPPFSSSTVSRGRSAFMLTPYSRGARRGHWNDGVVVDVRVFREAALLLASPPSGSPDEPRWNHRRR